MARPAIHAARMVKSVIDTQQEMVLAQPVVAVAPSNVHRAWAVPMVVVAFVALLGILLSTVVAASKFPSIKRPYAIVPAGAEQVESRLSLEHVKRYPSKGELLFVTIREPELPLLAWLMFWGVHHEKDIEPLTYKDVYGDGTPQQLQSRGRRQMVSAKQAAEYAALTKLGFPIKLQPGAIVIDQIICYKASADGSTCEQEAPSAKVLKADDELVSVDGVDIKVVDDLTPVLDKHKPGDTVEVKYKRPGVDGVQTGTIELVVSPDDPKRTLIGFYPFDTSTIGNVPFPINIDTEGIGGPSAGLAFALTLIDELTPGELTGGQRIAVTGTIDINGKVGAIGGLAQKASAVRQTGTKYFIVPASQSPESLAAARAVAEGDVEIIPVATLDEALAVLTRLGGNGNDLGQPGKDFPATG